MSVVAVMLIATVGLPMATPGVDATHDWGQAAHGCQPDGEGERITISWWQPDDPFIFEVFYGSSWDAVHYEYSDSELLDGWERVWTIHWYHVPWSQYVSYFKVNAWVDGTGWVTVEETFSGAPCDTVPPSLGSWTADTDWISEATLTDVSSVSLRAPVTSLWYASSPENKPGDPGHSGWRGLPIPRDDCGCIRSGWSWTGLTFLPGVNYLHLRVADDAGNARVLLNAYKYKFDGAPPVIDGLRSWTHPVQDSFYSRDDVTFLWDQPTAGSGIVDVRHDVGPATSDCSTILADAVSVPVTTTSATYTDVSSFGAHRFCLQAESGVGRVTTVTREFRIDLIKPTVDSQAPVGNRFFPSNNEPVEAHYFDRDGGLDDEERSGVRLYGLQLYVDGVDMVSTWSFSCGFVEGGGFSRASSTSKAYCPVEVGSNRILYTPPTPWSAGRHDVELRIADSSIPGNEEAARWSFSVLPAAVEDRDLDGIPDSLEADLCGNPTIRDALARPEVRVATCGGDDDLVVLDGGGWVMVPTGIFLGPDGDGDGLPSEVAVTRVQLTFVDESGRTTASVDPVEPVRAEVDTDDADPDEPATSSVSLSGIVLSAGLGSDEDGDGVHSGAHAETYRLTVDRTRPGVVSTERTPGDDVALPGMDPDDTDPDDPIPREVDPLGDADSDGDGVPDDAEWELCSNGSSILRSDGTCDEGGTNWSRPTVDDVLTDVDWLRA